MINTKKILILSRHSPYATSFAFEAFDMLAIAITYNEKVDLLLSDDGVYQLMSNQQPQSIAQKNISKMLASLAHFDLNKIYVDETSLINRGLNEDKLVKFEDIEFVYLSKLQIKNKLKQTDIVINF